jgi:hypothetical protein
MTFSTPQAIHQQCAFRAANAAMAAALKRDSQLTRFRLPRKILIQLSMFVVSKPPSKHLLKSQLNPSGSDAGEPPSTRLCRMR